MIVQLLYFRNSAQLMIIGDSMRFRNFWAICNTDDRQQQVLLRHEDKWDNLPQPRTNQADDLTRKFGWFNVILSYYIDPGKPAAEVSQT